MGLLSLPLWPWLLPNLNPNHTVVMVMVDMAVVMDMVDMVADTEDTVVDTMAAKRENPKLMPMLTQMPKLMPMLHPIIMVDTMAEDTDMVVMDTDIPMVVTDMDTTEAKDLLMLKPNPTTDMVDTTAEDTDTEDTEVMVDTVMADIMVEKFSQD